MREEVRNTMLEELRRNPLAVVDMLNLIINHINDSVEAAKILLNQEARLGLEMAIVSIRDRNLPASSCKVVLKQIFKVYGEPVEGDCEAVKKSWAYLQEEES